jgi:hypothetical protein
MQFLDSGVIGGRFVTQMNGEFGHGFSDGRMMRTTRGVALLGPRFPVSSSQHRLHRSSLSGKAGP